MPHTYVRVSFPIKCNKQKTFHKVPRYQQTSKIKVVFYLDVGGKEKHTHTLTHEDLTLEVTSGRHACMH